MRLDSTNEEQIENLKEDFAALVIETRRCLKKRYSDAEEAATWINEIFERHSR